ARGVVGVVAGAGGEAVAGPRVGAVTVGRRPADAEAAGAGVARRAGVAVAARLRVRRVDAPRACVAGVVGAQIPVVTVACWSADAHTRRTGIGGGGLVAVRARRAGGGVGAGGGGDARGGGGRGGVGPVRPPARAG